MGEYRNNPAIFDRLNYTKEKNFANGIGSIQHIIAGNGNELTEKQLHSFNRELKLRKLVRAGVFFSIPALAIFYKRNLFVGLASVVLSTYLSQQMYSLKFFNSNDAFTQDFIKKSKLNYYIKVAKAQEMVHFNEDNLVNGKIKSISKKEFVELNKYR